VLLNSVKNVYTKNRSFSCSLPAALQLPVVAQVILKFCNWITVLSEITSCAVKLELRLLCVLIVRSWDSIDTNVDSALDAAVEAAAPSFRDKRAQ